MSKIEDSLIGAFVASSENITQAIEFGFIPKWFSDPVHNLSFSFLVELSESNEWSPVTSVNVLMANGAFEKQQQLEEAYDNIPEWAHSIEDLQDAFDLIRVDYAARLLRAATMEIGARISSGDDPFDVASDISKNLDDMESIGASSTRTKEDIARDLIELDENIVSGTPIGLPFPWHELQLKTFGIPFSAVSPLCGRDGRGKSRLGTMLGTYWAMEGFAGLVMPFEDTETRCMRNSAAYIGGYDAFDISKNCSPDLMRTHKRCIEEVVSLPIYICDSANKINKIISEIAYHKRKHDIRWVIIDGFKDIDSSGGENRTQEETRIMRALTTAARKYKVAIIPVMHLNKVRDDQWVSKQDITGSGDQTKSARMVMVYQDFITPDIKAAVAPDIHNDGLFLLDVQKASYGNRAIYPLIKNLEEGRFDDAR